MDGVKMLGFGLEMERSIPHGGAALNPTYALFLLAHQQSNHLNEFLLP
jgi:hypothetical protein